jgi:colanic acid biosynthesis glycosyl transferase WcaI
MMMRLVITGISYAPETTGIAPYTSALAEHLAATGHQVSVITGVPSYPQWRVYPEYRPMLRARELRSGVEVRRVRNYVPRRQSMLRRGLYEASFLVGGMAMLGMPAPNAVVGVVPSLSGGVLARAAARRLRCPYGLIFQDLVGPAASQSGVGAGRFARPIGAAEAWIARGAAALGIIAEGFRPYLESLGVAPDRVHRLRNWLHVDEPTQDRTAIRHHLGLPLEALICLHAGNMGLKQELDNIVECARLAASADSRLVFILAGDGSQRPQLVALARRYQLRNLRFLPVQPVEYFSSLLAAADILLLNQRASVTSMSLPSKLTSYMAAGRPIVAAVQADSEAAVEIRAAGAGMICPPGNPAAILQAVRKLANDPLLRTQLGSSGQNYCRKELTSQQLLPQWVSFVERLSDGESGCARRPTTRPTTPAGTR